MKQPDASLPTEKQTAIGKPVKFLGITMKTFTSWRHKVGLPARKDWKKTVSKYRYGFDGVSYKAALPEEQHDKCLFVLQAIATGKRNGIDVARTLEMLREYFKEDRCHDEALQ